jgi:hypothetical protein
MQHHASLANNFLACSFLQNSSVRQIFLAY